MRCSLEYLRNFQKITCCLANFKLFPGAPQDRQHADNLERCKKINIQKDELSESLRIHDGQNHGYHALSYPWQLLNSDDIQKNANRLLELFPTEEYPDGVVGEYRMSYLILDDEIIVVSFVHGRSDVAHD
jgi:hypothetical protein